MKEETATQREQNQIELGYWNILLQSLNIYFKNHSEAQVNLHYKWNSWLKNGTKQLPFMKGNRTEQAELDDLGVFSNLNDSMFNTTESSKKGTIDRIFYEQETSALNNGLIQEHLKANRMNTLKPRRQQSIKGEVLWIFFRLELLGISRNNINVFYGCTAQIVWKWK